MNQEIITFGCRLNTYETEVIRKKLEESGEENVLVFNTCAVTNEAVRQARQAIRKAKKQQPDKRIIVTGCAAQINPGEFAAMSEVDLVIGNEEKLESKSYSLNPETEKIQVNDIMSIKETALHLVDSFEGKARAFLQIQNGCNHRCTFCQIPYGRGNSRSVAIGEIVRHVNYLVASGFNEIVLTGVDITDYGLDLPGKPTLAQMIKRLLNLSPDLKRLRLSSVDVAEIDEELFELLAFEKRIMPHIHISLQAGDDMVLKRMKRRHLRGQIVQFCEKLRKVRPEVAYGADIIAGFPTEDDEMFENTRKLIAEAGLQFLHVFPYSAHKNTPASRMPQVEQAIRKERAKILREEGQLELEKFMRANIGRKCEAIVENDNLARTDNYLQVTLDKSLEAGKLVQIEITEFNNNQLYAKIYV